MTDFLNKQRLDEKIAVVTGATGILGKVCCEALAQAGAKIAVVDINQELTQSFASQLSTTYGVPTLGISCDVTNESAVQSMVKEVESSLGSINILHNNAASKGSDLKKFFEPLETFSIETWREVMSVNLDGLFIVAREIGKGMAERGSGSIIQTGSIYGAKMGPDQRIYAGSDYMGGPINTPPVYTTSKAGVHGLTLHLATYWGHRGVRVNTITPGGVSSGQNNIFNDRYSARVPLGRMAQAEDIASGVLFLASEASGYITGQNLFIDGGLSAW